MKYHLGKYMHEDLMNHLLKVIPKNHLTGIKHLYLYNTAKKINNKDILDGVKPKVKTHLYELSKKDGFYDRKYKSIYIPMYSCTQARNRKAYNLPYHGPLLFFVENLYYQIAEHLWYKYINGITRVEEIRSKEIRELYKSSFEMATWRSDHLEMFKVHYEHKYKTIAFSKGLFNYIHLRDMPFIYQIIDRKINKTKYECRKKMEPYPIYLKQQLSKFKINPGKFILSRKETHKFLNISRGAMSEGKLDKWLVENCKPYLFVCPKKTYKYYELSNLINKSINLKFKSLKGKEYDVVIKPNYDI